MYLLFVRTCLEFLGSNEDISSFKVNLNQLLLLQAQDFPEMSSWFHNREYIFPEIINEVIKIFEQSVRWKVLANMKTAP